MHEIAKQGPNQGLLFLDPMHQIHNHFHDYEWQLKGKENTKLVKANTGRRRVNIIGAINPVSLQPTIVITEQNCCEELIHAFLHELKEQYKLIQNVGYFQLLF